ncbi:phage tail family [Chlorella sorokiniana]|uniref:Phage tail family n=1 Tax=Chlorella sorokiniana TaxID=3076 RepID=A0A2P6U200_CHLSO|nr:phage tail family [Chlorella sorokiniana]|eukprot:PRW60341.1 phage tail family [Chlorella sorokiniana]
MSSLLFMVAAAQHLVQDVLRAGSHSDGAAAAALELSTGDASPDMPAGSLMLGSPPAAETALHATSGGRGAFLESMPVERFKLSNVCWSWDWNGSAHGVAAAAAGWVLARLAAGNCSSAASWRRLSMLGYRRLSMVGSRRAA